MRSPRPAAVAIALVLLAPIAVAGAQPGSQGAERGARYLESRLDLFVGARPADTVGEALSALVAGGVHGAAIDRALAHLREAGPARADEKPAYAARIVAGLVAVAVDPRSFGGVDYVELIGRRYDPTTGAYDSNLYANALALLGLVAAGEPVPERAITYLRANQCPDGGFSWREGCLGPADSDTTAVAASVMLGTGVDPSDATVSRARLFMQRTQDASGGFGAEPGQPANANSTGLGLSLLAALGEDPSEPPWSRGDGIDPVSGLLALQTASGGFRYMAAETDVNDYATIQAVPGLAGAALPVRPPARAETRTEGTGGTTRTAAPPVRPVAAGRQERSVGAARQAGDRSRAGVVVRTGDGEIRRMCVFFDEPEITGEELLARTELDVEIEHMQFGAAVCRIGPDGCPAGDCFCHGTMFWGYWNRDPGGDWATGETGPSGRTVIDGSVDGWTWGQDGDPAPEDESLDEICAAAEPTDDAAPPHERVDAADEQPAAIRGGLIAFLAVLVVLVGAGTLLTLRRRRAAP